MKVTLIQTELFWEDRKKNLARFDLLISKAGESDLIILPEMFTTGFSMNPARISEKTNSVTLDWMKAKSKENNLVITGSVAVEENGNYYNRLYWVAPDGNFQIYDKRHLFRMAKEDKYFSAGNKKIITRVGDWKICPLICYDLRFPVWSRNRFEVGSQKSEVRSQEAGVRKQEAGGGGQDFESGVWDYDILIYVANWPEARNYPWKQLLIARAIENQCYVIGVNRIGKDGNGILHSGNSMVINPKGEIINETKPYEESVETVVLDKSYLDKFRKVFPVGMDADSFILELG